MSTYRVYMQRMVSAVVDVEAETVEEALENVHDADGMPGGITVGAFGGASVDEAGEWEAYAVYSEANEEVWKEKVES